MNILDYEDVDSVIMQCDSEKEVYSFLEHLEERGFQWRSGHPPTQWDGWLLAEGTERFVYRIEMRNHQIVCWRMGDAVEGSSVVLTFKDFTKDLRIDIEASEDLLQFLAGLCGK